MNFVYNQNAIKISGYSSTDDFSYSVIEQPESVGTSSVNQELKDANLSNVTPSSSKNNYKIVVNPSWRGGTIEFESKTANSIVDTSGNVQWVSDGVSEINIKTKVGTRRVSRPILSSTTPYIEFSSWRAGTLARHIEDNLSSMISGKIPSPTTLNYYSDLSETTPNPNRFTGNLNTNAISIGWYQNMVLISPVHVIGSHLSGVGEIRFLADDGSVLIRNVISLQRLNSDLPLSELDDNSIGLLDFPIPSSGVGSIKPIKFLPSDYETKISLSSETTYRIQMLRKKQAGGNKIEIIEGLIKKTTNSNSAFLRKSTRGNFVDWSSNIESGDSNGAVFFPIDSTGGSSPEIVLVTSINSTQGGRHYTNNLSEIQSKMNLLSSGYTIQTVDLSSFPTII